MSMTEKAMQNRFLSRGKRLDNGEWAIGWIRFRLHDGDLTQSEYDVYIQTKDYMDKIGKVYNESFEVDPATIGQCTSLPASKSYRGESETDRLVFEGDIVREDNNTAIVKFGYYTANDNKSYCNEEAFGFYLEHFSHSGIIDHISDFICWEIIGNIHDNIKAEDE